MKNLNLEDYFKELLDRYDQKLHLYGRSYEQMEDYTYTDILLYKMTRVKGIMQREDHRVNESIKQTLQDIAGYCMLLLMRDTWHDKNLSEEQLKREATSIAVDIISQHEDKNHDYNHHFQRMKPSSLLDIMICKTHRLQNLLDLCESEEEIDIVAIEDSIKDNLTDILTYAYLLQAHPHLSSTTHTLPQSSAATPQTLTAYC